MLTNALHPEFGWAWREDEIVGKHLKSLEQRHAAEIAAKDAEIEHLLPFMEAIRNCGLPEKWEEHPSFRYVTIQIDKTDWKLCSDELERQLKEKQ